MLTDSLVGPAKLAGTLYVETDTHCKDLSVESEIVQIGTVELTDNVGGVYSGHFQVDMVPSSDGAGGIFHSEPCPGARLDSPSPGC